MIFATARTQVDKVDRTVVFENLKITKSDFPDPARQGRRLRGRAADAPGQQVRTISLDRLEASLALPASSRRRWRCRTTRRR